MLIGVTGDTHNNLKSILKICSIFNELEVSLVMHSGDITLPKSLLTFSNLKMPMIGVFGNNDQEEKNGLIKISNNFDCSLFDEPHFFEKDGIKIILLHHPELIIEEYSHCADFIIHGHTHRYKLEEYNEAIIFNPGECAGIMKGKNRVGLIDTDLKTAKTILF